MTPASARNSLITRYGSLSSSPSALGDICFTATCASLYVAL
jgi:hypothetical protein